MSKQNRIVASSSTMSPSDRIRQLWPAFEQSVTKSRSVVDHRVKAAMDKADKEYERTSPSQRIPITQHYATKARIMKDLQDPHFVKVRKQWEERLASAGLQMEYWNDMSDAEMSTVVEVLGNPEGDDSSDDMVVVPKPVSVLTSPPPTQSQPTSVQPLAPSLSTSTRSTNVSTTSSYAVVDPSAFNSEDEDGPFFLPVVATSYDLTSDDDESSSLVSRRRQRAYRGWGSGSASSSFHDSMEDESDGPFALPPLRHDPSLSRGTSAGQQAAAQRTAGRSPSPKAKVSRQTYTGPSLDDAEEPLSDEEDFERFKMDTRIRKIVEFHQAAALADIELAIAIYKDRKAKSADKQEVASKVMDHQKRMSQLQMEKEEERKNIVKMERSKRRSDLRNRPGRSGTLVAPRPSVPTNPSWLNDFQDRAPSRMQAELDISKILSENAEESRNNVDQLLQHIFPMASSSSPPLPPVPSQAPASTNSYHEPLSQEPRPLTSSLGWGMPSTSTSAAPPVPTGSPGPQQLPKRRLSSTSKLRSSRLAKPSLFGDDESSDEDDEDSPPQTAQPLTARPTATANDFFADDANILLSNQLMAEPDLASAFAQWTGGLGPNEYQNPVPSTPSWGPRQAVHTPTVDHPSPWAPKDVPSAPVGSGWGKRKLSFSAGGPANPADVAFSPFGQPEALDHQPTSMAAMAAFNSANKGKKPAQAAFAQPSQVEVPKSSTPAPVAVPATPKTDKSSSAPIPTKKMNKKQRQNLKKAGIPVAAATEEQEQDDNGPSPTTPSNTSPSQSMPHDAPSFSSSFFASDPAPTVNAAPSTSRTRKNSTAWDEVTSTPRPAPRIPAHLQEAFADKPGPAGKSKLVESERRGSNSSTIKGSPWASATSGAASSVGAAARSAWSIFSGNETPAPAAAQPATPTAPGSDRNPWLPGGFEDDDGDSKLEPSLEGKKTNGQASQFWAPPVDAPQGAPSASVKQQPISVAQRRLQQMNEPAVPSPPPKAATPAAHAPAAAPSPAGGKKGKGKKGRGRKVTVEEVVDDEQDSRGEKLPVDSRYIMEPQAIVEPKPSVPSRMFDSIIGYGDEDGGETTSSSYAHAPSTAPTSPPDIFGDEARLAAAIQEMQNASIRGAQQASAMGWGASSSRQHATWTPSSSESELPTSNFSSLGGRASGKPASTPAWGQMSATDKGRASAANLGGSEYFAAPMANPTLPNMKRGKVAAGW